MNKLKACLKEAYRDRLIAENLSDFVRGFKPAESNREYLTFEELESLANTQCMYPVLKAAFIFSCLTGIRWSDIHRLTWLNLRHSDKRGYELSFSQKKTGGKEYLPISEQAEHAEKLAKSGMQVYQDTQLAKNKQALSEIMGNDWQKTVDSSLLDSVGYDITHFDSKTPISGTNKFLIHVGDYSLEWIGQEGTLLTFKITKT